ncbi:hypothetical protein E2C01_005641 [Portunus trituberculatus]|uniref:Uncharacterized protein n=1 Tax=Portunus trituberculatus TaxID=210409 RepID=A0A5B7CUW4_PORTR|nr:hypothetical protein [Portunus trituberculatus]
MVDRATFRPAPSASSEIKTKEKTAGGRVLQRILAKKAPPRASLRPYIMLHVSLQRVCKVFSSQGERLGGVPGTWRVRGAAARGLSLSTARPTMVFMGPQREGGCELASDPFPSCTTITDAAATPQVSPARSTEQDKTTLECRLSVPSMCLELPILHATRYPRHCCSSLGFFHSALGARATNNVASAGHEPRQKAEMGLE